VSTMTAFRPGDRVRVRCYRCPPETGTVEAGPGRRVTVRLDSAGVRMAFQAADLEPDLPPPAPEPALMTLSAAQPSYPGPYAVPGLAQPGFAWPAEPVTEWAPGLLPWRYTEVYTLIYVQYLDVAAQRTLVAVPGGTYYMNAVGDPGIAAAPPGDNRWTPSTG
jgi:hypothetical protein